MQAQFILSAASASDFPTTGLPEIALVGRSNVGKSSLINALVKQTVARTSAAPGKTRLANYYLIHSPIPNRPSLYLVDLPGYGFARGGRESAEAFETLTRRFFDPSAQPGRHVAGILHLIDGRHPSLPQDAVAYKWLLSTRLPVAMVATKMDKLTQSQKIGTLRRLEASYDSPVLPESAVDGTGLDAIWKVIGQWA